MTSNLNTLKIQVPIYRPAPPNAYRIGEFAAHLLGAIRAAGTALVKALTAASPSTIRAELRHSATGVEAQRPAAALSLRSVAAKGWIH